MYYVAKTYKNSSPSLVEFFYKKDQAIAYASLMNDAGKGDFIVLEIIKF